MRIFFGVVLGLSSAIGAGPRPSPATAGPDPGLQVTLRPDGLDLDWLFDTPTIQAGPDGAATLSLDGCVPLDEPGQPALPVCRKLVALPPGAEPEVVVTGLDEQNLSLPDGAWVAADQQPALNPDGSETTPPAQPYQDDFSPDPVQIKYLGRVAGLDLAQLTLYPLRISAGGLVAVTHIQASINFQVESPRVDIQGNSDPLVDTVRAELLNPQQAQVTPAETAPQTAAIQGSGGSPRAAIEVSQIGITAVTYAELQSAGFPVGQVDPHDLHLTRAGVEIPIQWQGNDNTTFESNEYFLFYAAPRFSRYTSTDVYFLSFSADPSELIPTQDGDPSGLTQGQAHVQQTFEQNNLYTPDCNCAPIPAGRDGDRWVWDDLRFPDRTSATYTFNLTDPDTTSAAQLTLWVIGYTDVAAANDHRIQAAVNGTSLGSLTFDGKQAAATTLAIPANVLKTGANSLKLTLPSLPGITVEGLWLDAFALDYVRTTGAVGQQAQVRGEDTGGERYTIGLSNLTGLLAYDVTDPDQPRQLENMVTNGNTVQFGDPAGAESAHSYSLSNASGLLAPARVRMTTALQTASGANELIIAPQAFISGLSSLVNLRRSQGLSVAVQDVQGIYDWYDGRPTADAIRAYLASIYTTWSPRPDYILLVGDGTADPKHYLSSSSATYIPPYLADVDPLAGETAADNQYVTVDGADDLPDYLLGRLPVNSTAELAAVVQKLVQYDQTPTPGLWRQTMAFVADTADSTSNFQATANAWIQELTQPPQIARKLYYNPAQNDDAAFRQAVFNQWQDGDEIMVYHGHSSIHQWGVERFFHLDDVSGLTNAPRLPVLLEMTCLTGSFQVPNLPTLDESLLRQPNGGAIAVWGSTGFGYSSSQDLLANGFLALLDPGADVSIGAATLAGKLNLANQTDQGLDALDTFSLLGDPATFLHMDTTTYHLVDLPLVIR